MPLSRLELGVLHANASNLAEVLAGDFSPASENQAVGETRLARWKHVTSNSPEQFSAMVAAMNAKPHAEWPLAARLGPLSQDTSAKLPAWALMAADIVETLEKMSTASGRGSAPKWPAAAAAKPVPFVDVYWPIAEMAKKRVVTEIPAIDSLLDVRAWRGLQKQLLLRISAIASSALHARFLAHKSFETSGFAAFFQRKTPAERDIEFSDGRRLYSRFINEQRSDGLRFFFLRYPVAARLISQVTLDWIASVGEFVRRLQEDWQVLSATFNNGDRLPAITKIESNVSDPHHGGRTVLILAFRNDLRLVYKPRSLNADLLFFELARALNARSAAPNLRVLNVLECENYGWMEFAVHKPCVTKTEIRRFYQRAGSLIYLVNWLRGIDFHRENLIAAGEDPVLVDLETLMHPLRPDEDQPLAGALVSLGSSALRTGLLPLLQSRFTGRGLHDNSGLGAPAVQRSAFDVTTWKQVNTDLMAWRLEVHSRKHTGHLPRWQNRAVSCGDYAREVLSGYQQMEALLSGNDSSEFAQKRQAICQTERRRIKRATLVYSMLLQRSLQPNVLTNGIDRSIELQALPCIAGDEDEWVAEIASLERLDVPHLQIDVRDGSSQTSTQTFSRSQQLTERNIIRLSLQRRLMIADGGVYRR